MPHMRRRGSLAFAADRTITAVHLRDYMPADFEGLWRLDQLCFEPEIAYSRAELRQFLALKGAFAIVAERDRSIAGFILGHRRAKRGHIITIDVLPEHRRHGLGSTLLAAAEKRLRAAGADALYLEVAVDNAAAIQFYERFQFRLISRLPGYYLGKRDAFRLGKPLQAAL